MADTPNTSRPSDAIQRYDPDVGGGGSRDYYAYMSPDPLGEWVGYDDHLAALARAREEARREAWNNALVCAENAVFEVARSRKNKRTNEFKLPLQEIEAIRALAVPTPTPQGESRVDQKRPPPPEDLVDALQDRVHPASGPLIQSKPVTPQGETKEND